MLRARLSATSISCVALTSSSSSSSSFPVAFSSARFVGGVNDANPSYIHEVSVDPAKNKHASGTRFVHPRSGYEYAGSNKAKEVGARNEAAFIDYKPTQPDWCHHPTAYWAMPHVINLLTVAPVSVGLSFLAAFFWGVSFWRFYASKNFRSVIIERPVSLEA